jgi:hypothetical protein
MNDEQRRVAGFQAQPEGTGPFFRNPALALMGVDWLHGTRAALSCEKMASVATTIQGLTGPRSFNENATKLKGVSSWQQ